MFWKLICFAECYCTSILKKKTLFFLSLLAALGNISLSISDVEPIKMEIRSLNKSALCFKTRQSKSNGSTEIRNLFSLQEYSGMGDGTHFYITVITKIPVSGPAGMSVPQSYCKGQRFWSLSLESETIKRNIRCVFTL